MSEAHSDPFLGPVPSPRTPVEDMAGFAGRHLTTVPDQEQAPAPVDLDATQEIPRIDAEKLGLAWTPNNETTADIPPITMPTPPLVGETSATTPPTPPRRGRRGLWTVAGAVASVPLVILGINHFSGGDEKEQNTTSDAALDQVAENEVEVAQEIEASNNAAAEQAAQPNVGPASPEEIASIKPVTVAEFPDAADAVAEIGRIRDIIYRGGQFDNLDDSLLDPPVFSQESQAVIDQGFRDIFGVSYDNYASLHADGGNELTHVVARIGAWYSTAEITGNTANFKLNYQNIQVSEQGEAGARVTFDHVVDTNIDDLTDNPTFDEDYHVTSTLQKVPDADGNLVWVMLLPETKYSEPYYAPASQQ